MRKKLYSLLLIGTISCSIFNTPVSAAETSNQIAQQEVANELGGNVITFNDIPENVIPIKFDTIEQAKNYIELSDKMLSEGKQLSLSENDINSTYDTKNKVLDFSNFDINENDYKKVDLIENTNLDIPVTLANTGIKVASIKENIISSINIYASYTYANSKFTSVTGVTSSYTGVTMGNAWTQDTYSSSITSAGKKLNVTVYGHYDHYILVNTTLTKIGSSKADYSASWNY